MKHIANAISFGAENSAKQYDDRKLSAMSVFLIDFQITQSIKNALSAKFLKKAAERQKNM